MNRAEVAELACLFSSVDDEISVIDEYLVIFTETHEDSFRPNRHTNDLLVAVLFVVDEGYDFCAVLV